MPPRITTILPTFRRPERLGAAIESVLAQTFTDFQVCVYDNASGDATEAVVREYQRRDPRVAYERHRENIGGLANFIHGMRRVQTPYFSFLSDDDLLLPRFFEAALAAAERYPEAGFAACQIVHVDAARRVLEPFGRFWHEQRYLVPPAGLLAMLEHGPPTWTSILFRREVMDTVGLLDPAMGGPADFEFEMRAAAALPFVVDPTPGGVLFLGEGAASSGGQLSLLWPAWQDMIDKLAAEERLDPRVRAEVKQKLTESLMTLLFKCGVGASRRGRWEDAGGAAQVLRRRFGRHRQAALIDAVRLACRLLPPLRGLLGRMVMRSRHYLRRDGHYVLLEEYLAALGHPLPSAG